MLRFLGITGHLSSRPVQGPVRGTSTLRLGSTSGTPQSTSTTAEKHMNLRALKNNILFQFLDKTEGSEGTFSERTRSGLIIPKLQATQKGERWGEVMAVGPDVDGVQVGDYVLIEP